VLGAACNRRVFPEATCGVLDCSLESRREAPGTEGEDQVPLVAESAVDRGVSDVEVFPDLLKADNYDQFLCSLFEFSYNSALNHISSPLKLFGSSHLRKATPSNKP
jgi:hypothetical protein